MVWNLAVFESVSCLLNVAVQYLLLIVSSLVF